MNQLSKEDRAVIYGMYIGADVSAGTGNLDKLRGFNIPNGEVYISSGIVHFDFCKLLLTDLADITDEDALKVAKILGFTTSLKEMGKWYVKDGFIHKTDASADKFILLIDFLRSRSYALPYKSVNLFDAGIAIRKQDRNDTN